MSDHRRYEIHCDHAGGCFQRVLGDINQPPSRIRPSARAQSWYSRKRPQSQMQKQYDIYPTDYQDFCPQHAKFYNTPEDES